MRWLSGVVLLLVAGCSEDPARDPLDLGESPVDRGASLDERAVVDGETGPLPDGSQAGAEAGADMTPPQEYDCQNPHPAWLHCDDFEGMAAGIDAWFSASGWTDSIGADNPGRLTSSTQAHEGKYAAYMPAAASAGYQGADLIWRACDGTNKAGCPKLKGYSKLHLRAYIRFAADHKKVHHFLNVGGGPIDDYWAPYGNAGCRPNGKRAMGTTVDFKEGSHETFFYTYFPAMKCDSAAACAQYNDPQKVCDGCAKKDMPCTNGLECCWGNHFKPATPVTLPLGKWFCFEMMMKQNDIGQKNGEMAYWVEGKLALHVKNMEFRTDSKLQLNKVGLQHYLTTSDAAGHSNQVWFDDVVVSTQPVGCQ
jgi:hypothetical protein